jgi:peptidoglycan/xylan/chitin deacetylase (PgdA/CDA1 family)
MAWTSFAEIEKAALELTTLKVPARSSKTVLQQFQAGHGYEKSEGTGTLSDDTGDFVIGTQSLKFVTAGDEVQSHVRKKSVGPYDFSGKDLRLTFKVDGLVHVSTFEVFLSSDNLATNNVHYPISIPVQPYIADGEWATMTISWGDLVNNFAPGTITRNKVNFVEFRFEDDGAGPVTFHVNEIAAVPQPGTGVVSIVFDDGWQSTYTRARPNLDRYGYRATAVIIRDLIGTANYLTLAQTRALQTNSGWDIGAHANTVADHNAGFANLEDSVVETDLQGIKRWLIENGFKRRDLFAWPQGSFTASQMIIARRFFNGIRGTTGGRGGATGPQETFPPGENGRLRTWVVGSTATAAEAETALSQCATHKSWLIISFHELVASGAEGGLQTNEAAFKAIVEKIAASGLAVKTVAEVLES